MDMELPYLTRTTRLATAAIRTECTFLAMTMKFTEAAKK
jgi:hypothetical protein